MGSGQTSPNGCELVGREGFTRRRRKWYIPGPMFGPYSFVNVASGKEALGAENGTKNTVEVAVTLKILELLYKACSSSGEAVSIGVVSPFPAQIDSINQKLENRYQYKDGFMIDLGLLDEFHREVDILIVSTVGSDGEGQSPHETSAVFTKARNCLWILGDERAILHHGSIWESFIIDAKARQCFFHADEHKDLTKVILQVKKDLDQLDDVLNEKSSYLHNAAWKILFSEKFRRSFSKIESLETKQLVLLMLSKLSTGWRQRRINTAAAVTKSAYSEILKEFKVKGLHLICTIEIFKEKNYTQVLKVWDILPFHHVAELVGRLEQIMGAYTKDYLNHCKEKCAQRGMEFPMNWPLTCDIRQYESETRTRYKEKVRVHESLMLMKFYSLSSGMVNNMISGCDGGDLGAPFELTQQEKEVVSFDKSSFILGRSGTGKTTVLTMKLLENEKLYHLSSEGFHEIMESDEEVKQDSLHQIFVTLSARLCYAVKKHVSDLKRLMSGGSSSSLSPSTHMDDIGETTMLEDAPCSFVGLPHEAYPLIITFHTFLLMLDGTVGTSYFQRFPLVAKLLSNDQSSSSRIATLERYMRSKVVTYDKFSSAFWPHFDTKLTKNLDPLTVYTEIMSVIKGGLRAGNTHGGILSMEEYVSLFSDRISLLNEQKRETMYSIFLEYEKKKLMNGNFDLADVVNDLHRRLEDEGYRGDHIHYVYIDEVQDLSMRQISLFKYMCSNVHEGFAFSGDTAQAIAKGIGFRFEDIRCLFFNEFLLGSQKGDAKMRNEMGKISKIFQLTQNFRTHAGVLNLAQSIIDLLYQFFPLFVDVLSPETSRVSGELPVLLQTDINAIKSIFGSGEGQRQVVGFGADQVILVRDEHLKQEIVDVVGKNALVLTIMESKGLEFQDVLLYNFFTTSAFMNEWRIVYEYMKQQNLLDSTSASLCLTFNLEKHALLCSELKQLYVAITRTRQRLWISESIGFSHPIFDYWKRLKLIEIKPLTDSFAAEMQVPSSKDQWLSRGKKLFYEKNYKMARMCFSKSGDMISEKLAEASELRARADCTFASVLERKNLLHDAANLFSSIGKNELAAECYHETMDYETAGDIYLKESMLEKAGDCFYQAKSYERAVETYDKARVYSKCFSACSDGKLFEIGFGYIGHCAEGYADVVRAFMHKGARHFFGINDMKNMVKFVASFHSKHEMRSFLMKNKRFDVLVSGKGWGDDEDNLVDVAGLHKESSLMILWHVFSCSPIFQESANGPFAETRELLLKRAVSIAKRDSADFHMFVCKGYEILRKGESREELLERGLEFVRLFMENPPAGYEVVKTIGEIENIEQDLLERSARHYHDLNDPQTMMRFVSSFRSVGSMRRFFESVNRFDDLLLLEEVHRDYIKASKIAARKMGRSESDRDEDHRSKEAALIHLWYAFFGSLWANGKRAWPLKHFKQKYELLDGARWYAENHPDRDFSALVRAEITILSSAEIRLSQMWRYFHETLREKSVRAHFTLVRKILDVHLDSCPTTYAGDENETRLDGLLSKDIVSIEGLVHFWSCFKALILELIDCSNTGSKVYVDFVSNYFGVRKFYDGGRNDRYIVLNAEAHWVKSMNPSIIQRGYLSLIGAREFLYVAKSYWCSELTFVAEKVLEKLATLHARSTASSFPVYRQVKILKSTFEVSGSLRDFEFRYGWHRAREVVEKYFQQCVEQCLNAFFRIDWKNAPFKDMIRLRGSETLLKLLEEAMNQIGISKVRLTYRELGRVVVMLLGSRMGIFRYNTIQNVIRRSPRKWGDLIRILSSDGSKSNRQTLALSLRDIVNDVFSANWSADGYISPGCFLYIVERLLILTSCSRGYIFTTRFSCVEWLSYCEPRVGSRVDFDVDLETTKGIHRFLASMVSKLLVSPDDLKKWITKSNDGSSYDILVVRLVVLLSLICVNSGDNYSSLNKYLRDDHIVSSLPSAFREALIMGGRKSPFLDALAAAFRAIDNPLMIVSLTKDLTECSCHDSVFLNTMNPVLTQEMLLEVLYPEKREEAVTMGNDHEKSKFPLLSSRSCKESMDFGSEAGYFSQMVENLELCHEENSGSVVGFVSFFPAITVEVEKYLHSLSSSIACSLVEDHELLMEADDLLDKLKQLCFLLDIRQPDMKARIPKIVELLKSLRLPRLKLSGFLENLFKQDCGFSPRP